MPERLTLSNTSPLLYLHQIGKLDLLPRLYTEITIPPAVQQELQAGAERHVDVPDVMRLPWLRIQPLTSTTLLPLVTDLGPGESEVIALGLEYPHCRLIVDDTLGRRIARLNHLTFTGTLGVIVKAKQAGLLPAVAPVIAALRTAGLWLNEALIADVLQQAGEE